MYILLDDDDDGKCLPRPNRWITNLPNGVLYRAIVTLPNYMIEPDQPFEERIVFYEAPGIKIMAVT